MEMNLAVLGLIFDIVGVFILTLVAIIDYPHQRIFNEKEWWKRYWWQGWRPIFKIRPPNEKARWKIKMNSMVVRYGFIPPKHQWNIIGFLFVLTGFLLQLWFYLS
ncbi:hypothetical protein J4221_06650 [Candidatus Pacearchaeota archaeon]|nr:hypothetical protein [Candidatus Pacearchaeota archaeon]